MAPHRKTSLAAGIFYVLTFVSVPTLSLYRAVRSNQYILGTGPDEPVVIGLILEMIVALTSGQSSLKQYKR